MANKRNSEWQQVVYPQKKSNLLKFFLLIFINYIDGFLFNGFKCYPPLIINIPIIYRSISFNWLVELIIVVLWVGLSTKVLKSILRHLKIRILRHGFQII